MKKNELDITWLEEEVFFRPLEYGEKHVLEQSLEIRQYSKGETIITQGEPSSGLFFLKSGVVSLHINNDGRLVCIGRLQKNAQLGDMALFEGTKTSATVIAEQNCNIYFLSQQTMVHLMTFRRNMARDIMMRTIRQLSSSLRQMNKFEVRHDQAA